MKKRMLAAALCLVCLFSCGAWAEGLEPTDEFFDRGREALMLLSGGEVDEALEVLDFAFDVEGGLTEDTFRQMVGQMALLKSGSVQTEVALCWLDEAGVWHLGLPLVEPVSWDVEVLVLDSRDLEVFCGYSSSNWGALEEAAAISDQAYWNVEYAPGEMVLMADE